MVWLGCTALLFLVLAWVLGRKGVTAPIVGARNVEQLRDALAAMTLKLSADEVSAMEGPYIPHLFAG